ncbi:F-box protein At5g07610-like [Bidens hawaiensis]|uniref:F-box protein At5g07610-like n=1 Tax=Bidens hawaiensis TaxID=980011 RepID=UPI00404A1EB8
MPGFLVVKQDVHITKYFCITFSYPDPTRDVILVEIQIYSSNARKWKKLNRYFSESSCNKPFGNGVYWNEAVYRHPSDRNILSYFDLNLEKLKELPIPSPKPPMKRYGYHSTYLYFGESRGHLHWVGTAKYGSRIYLLVYEMSRDHSCFVKYKVEIRDIPDVCPQMIRNNQFEVIDIVRGEEEDVFMVLKVKNKIIRYNILDKSCKHMTTVNNLIRIGSGEVHRYIQSLTSF